MGDGVFLTQPWGLLSPHPALDAWETNAYIGPFGVAEQSDSEESSEIGNNAFLGPGLPESGYIDPQLLSSGGAGNVTAQVASGQDGTGLGSVDGPQAAIETP